MSLRICYQVILMSVDDIQSEFNLHGKLSRRAVFELQSLLLSDDAYCAITVAADTGCSEVAPQVVQCLSSADPMIRWNAAATLFTRFRANQYAAQCLDLVEKEQDEIVRSVALVGLGELLPSMEDRDSQRRAHPIFSRCSAMTASIRKSDPQLTKGFWRLLASRRLIGLQPVSFSI